MSFDNQKLAQQCRIWDAIREFPVLPLALLNELAGRAREPWLRDNFHDASSCPLPYRAMSRWDWFSIGYWLLAGTAIFSLVMAISTGQLFCNAHCCR